MAIGFNVDEFGTGLVDDVVAEVTDAWVQPRHYKKGDGSFPMDNETGQEISWYSLAGALQLEGDEMDEPFIQLYGVGSLSFIPDGEEEAIGRGFFPSNDGEEYAGGADVDEIREMASPGGVYEWPDLMEDEDYRGWCLLPVPDEDGNEPTKLNGGTHLAKLIRTLNDLSEGKFKEVDLSDLRNLVGLKCHWKRLGQNNSGPLMPIELIEMPSGAKTTSKKKASGSKKKAKSSSPKKKATKSSKPKSSKKAAEVDEEAIEAAIVEAIEASDDGTISTTAAVRAAQKSHKDKGSKVKTEAMRVAKDDDWISDDDRPWLYDDGDLSIIEDDE